ncbi:MAG: TonB family protein [Candidatus Eiseniibacteriota bacterium]
MSSRALLGSALIHAAVLWTFFFFVPPGRVRPIPNAIQVALVNLPTSAIVPSRGEPVDVPAPKEPARDEPKAQNEPAPEKNSVRPPDAKKPVPKRPSPGIPGGVRTETAPLGVAGLSGDVAVDAADFEFTYYLIAIRNRISQNWGAPTGIVTQGNRVRCVVYFKIDRLGRVSDVKLEESSGVAFFDQSAQRAVSVSSPLPPLPAGYGEGHLGVHFGFQYADR